MAVVTVRRKSRILMSLSMNGNVSLVELHHSTDSASHFGEIDVYLYPPRTAFFVILERDITYPSASPEGS